MNLKFSYILLCAVLAIGIQPYAHASEVVPETNTSVLVREHPKTGKPYVVITSKDAVQQSYFQSSKKVSRPDYRLLDPKVKSGQIPYDGPYSDSKRIYIFAASVATLGAGSLVTAAALPAAASSGAAAAGGGGAYLAAGGAVAAGTTAAALASTKPNSKTDSFVQESASIKDF